MAIDKPRKFSVEINSVGTIIGTYEVEAEDREEARELAYSGARILHPYTLIPLERKNIPLNVRNTFNLDNSGTYIVSKRRKNEYVVEGITHKEGFALIYIEKTGMNEEIGYIHKVSGIFAEEGI